MIPVNEPVISKNAKIYIKDCLDSGWISSSGKYIEQFENNFKNYIGSKFAVTTTSGTSALHLALAASGIKAGDEVIMPDLTIISCALSAVYMGAKPVLVDVENSTGNIDPTKIEEMISKKTKAIMVVHLYGHPVNIEPIAKLAKKYNLLLIEDAAEAHGAKVKVNEKWQKVGSIGDISCFSFYGNKIVTTGEGGMLLTNNQDIFKKARLLKDLSHVPGKRFFHEEVGYNFRMTNLQAALGVAQLGEINNYLKKKRWMAKKYSKALKNIKFLELPNEEPYAKNVFWMYALRVKKDAKITRDDFCNQLRLLDVDSRTYFVPLHKQTVLKNFNYKKKDYPISSDLSDRGFYLPSGLAITERQINKVILSVKMIAKNI